VAGRFTLDGMADTRALPEIDDETRALGQKFGFGPEDLPGLLELAKELGIDLKDLLGDLVNKKNSTAITIVNRTQHPLIFIGETRTQPPNWRGPEGEGAGMLQVLPPDRIEPGDSGTFLSQDEPGVATGDEGWLTYAIGSDDHSLATLYWRNVEHSDNLAESQIDYPHGQTRPDGTQLYFWSTEAFPKHGSTMMPFEYVVHEEDRGGGGDGVVDRNSCVITVLNETEQSLFLLDMEFNDGDVVSFPDDEIPSEGETTFTVSEKLRPDHRREGVTGYARYSVTQDFQHALWTLQWHNPEVGGNVAQNTLDGSSAALYQAGPPMMPRDQKENTPVRFVLRDAGGGGGGGGKPVPVPVKPREEPPPETDEPTLRHGDKSVDGWVEYLQDLLNLHGHFSNWQPGDFDDPTLRAVRSFQTDMKKENPSVMVDGVVGHQTWALLREEEPRPPSTDGRSPHTYVEHGPEARWNTEDEGILYDTNQDWLAMGAFVVGDVSIEASQHTAVADFTPVGGGATVQLELEMFAADGHTAHEHEHFSFGLRNVSTHLTEGVTYDVHAWMHPDLGGDDVNGRFTV
jgi:hypothetical protein